MKVGWAENQVDVSSEKLGRRRRGMSVCSERPRRGGAESHGGVLGAFAGGQAFCGADRASDCRARGDAWG